MGFRYGYCLVCLILLMPATSYSQDFTPSRATYYGSPDCLGTSTGACGFGEYGSTVNDARVAGVSRLYYNGTGCGACYQARCKVPQLCTEDGVNVVVTDYGEGDRTDFIMSRRAYSKMARANMVSKLLAYGVVDVEFRRISCRYAGYNLMFKIHENSRYPEYLAIVILYQGGQNDILDVQMWQEDCQGWVSLRNAFGAVWDRPNPPEGDITLRFHVSGSAGRLTWVQATTAIPEDWKAGVAYDSQIQLT